MRQHLCTLRVRELFTGLTGLIDWLFFVFFITQVDLLRTVLRGAERRRGRSFYDSEPIDRQSSALLVHSLERCMDESEQERDSYTCRIEEVCT